MSSTLYADLAWLPRPPRDFTAQCRALTEAEDAGPRIRTLANHALDGNQLDRLAKNIDTLARTGRSLAPLTPFRLGLVGSGTLDFIVPALAASAARHGILLDCVKGDYDQILQEALSPASHVNSARPDAVLVAIDHRSLPVRPTPGDAAGQRQNIAAALDYIAALRAGLKQHGNAICIVQTLVPPAEPLFGSFDRAVPGTWRSLIDGINKELAASLAETADVLFDVAGLAETVGIAEWYSPAQWNLAKLPFSSTYVPLYADHVARLVGALRGKNRRCLVLDLDNTVWGGVIGDDGLEGIRIAQGDATGEAFLSVQRMALDLRERGVVLAVSSKNTDEVARQPFREHPEMLLREEHIAVFQANWSDKASNIQAIADELSLGLDAMVFLDDNPVERGLIRQVLPQVAIPALPEDPALYARTLAAAGYFETIVFSDEDRKRASFYEENARRATLQKQVGDLDAYLASLYMRITFQPFDTTGRARIAQLINKSNQFNLTTRRYTEAAVAEAERDPDCLTLQIRLADMFGDNGMISVVICRRCAPAEWEIDTWLMSCRVLGRKVEHMVLREILHHARKDGIRRLVGIYRPTERNGMVRDHYAKLGFSPTEERTDDETRWVLETDAAIESAPMAVQRLGFDIAVT
jgi:FkbH-like protein